MLEFQWLMSAHTRQLFPDPVAFPLGVFLKKSRVSGILQIVPQIWIDLSLGLFPSNVSDQMKN